MSRLMILGLATLTAGCGDGRVPTYPVSGTVRFNDRSPEGWMAVLHPEPPPTGEHPHPLPRAKVHPDGRFRFRTYGADDGAPAGTYRVSFVQMGAAPPTPAPGDEADGVANPVQAGTPNPPDKKSRQVYMPHPVQVAPGENELPPFEIK